jgi:hypothetical protein
MQVSTYFGSDKTRDEFTTLALTKIPEQLRDNEAELRTTRWFDYPPVSR